MQAIRIKSPWVHAIMTSIYSCKLSMPTSHKHAFICHDSIPHHPLEIINNNLSLLSFKSSNFIPNHPWSPQQRAGILLVSDMLKQNKMLISDATFLVIKGSCINKRCDSLLTYWGTKNWVRFLIALRSNKHVNHDSSLW